MDRFKLIYQDVDDIDLFIGGITETPLPGAIVGGYHVYGREETKTLFAILGPTFRCIIGDQFKRLQQGDRYFYDNIISPSALSPQQLHEVRHASLARINCDNGDDIKTMQTLAFRQPSFM